MPDSPSPETAGATDAALAAALEPVAGWVRDAAAIVVLTGAGISTESGIPDFRGPNGVWTKNPAAEKTATLQHYLADGAVREQAWRHRMDSPMWRADPNAGHEAVATLEHKAALSLVVTQNIDGLHHAAGSSPDLIVEIHGTALNVKCMQCGWRGPMQETLDRVRAGDPDPACLTCGGILKSATISFGENLVVDDLERSQQAAATCDLFLALGSSLGVYPAAALPEIAVRAGARLVVMNAEPTPFDGVADAVIREPLGRALTALTARL